MRYRLAFLLALLTSPLIATEPAKPKLVVLVVFDQMRGDYIQKWQPLFGKDGFVRLQSEGAWYVNCHYPYAMTATGPGHSSMLTGSGPDVHGIIGNTWYDRASGAVVNCSESTRYTRVPPLPKDLPKDEVLDEIKAIEAKQPKKKSAEDTEAKPEGTGKEKPYGAPDRLLAPTFGDAIKAATGGKAKVFGLSFKDRSAVLPVGAKADGAYWLDSADGMIVTSSFYRDAVHPWVAELNRKRIADQWFGKSWERFHPDLDYVKYSGPDDVVGEGKGIRQGVTFPHRMDGGLKRPGKAYYEALATSPFGNDFLLELVRAAVVAEKLGQHEVPDLLTISFSSNDLLGHVWGPDSQEVLDVTLRSDRQVAALLKLLDEEVGTGKYLLCLTADHGICPLPEVSAKRGIDARRVSVTGIIRRAESYLRTSYAPDLPPESKTKFIENRTGLWVYLNYKLLESMHLKPADVARTLADYLANQEGIGRTFTRAELEGELDSYDAIGRRMRKACFPGRAGDVSFILKPYWLEEDPKTTTGTLHGTPYPYDTHVPLLVFGPSVKPGVRRDEVVPASIASIFAKALGIAPPAKAEYPVPEGLFQE
jgi:predicted AlkP superfamily pyrophosphatase or phosphodiesterase